MSLFNRTTDGLMDVIRCDEPEYLIWKWQPTGAGPDSKRANSIRWGSSLRVKEGSVAVFVCPQANGIIQEYIEGPFDGKLETKNLPVLTNVIGALYNGDSPFQAEIYFINLAQLIQIKFGVPFFDVFDPRFLDFGVPTAVRGSINFKITDYQEFIKLHRLEEFDMATFQTQVKDAVTRAVKNVVANAPASYGIPVVQLERKVDQINELVEEELKGRLSRDFGVTATSADISAIEIDKTSEGYQQLKSVTQDTAAATIQAQTAVNIQKMKDTQKIEAEHLEGFLKAQREEAQFAQRLKTESEHLTAHQIDRQAAVGITGAEALGKMSAAGGGDMGGGMNPAGMMAGMVMGGAIGQSMVGMMAGLNQPVSGTVPPPVPTVAYHVAVNGQAAGPFDLAALSDMATKGQLTRESLVWKAGMESWSQAGTMEELKGLFVPPLP